MGSSMQTRLAHSRPWPTSTQLARQLTALVTTVARRVIVIAIGVAVVTFIIGGLSYLTGLAALDGSARSAWTLIGARDAGRRRRRAAARVVAAVAGQQGTPPSWSPRSAG